MVITSKEIIKELERNGFTYTSRKGSHIKMTNKNGKTAIVPGERDLHPGTLKRILKQSGINIKRR